MNDARKPPKPLTLSEAVEAYDKAIEAQQREQRQRDALTDSRRKSGRLARVTAQLDGVRAAPVTCACGALLYSDEEIARGQCAHCVDVPPNAD